MKAVFVRHAPSDANESKMFAGANDVPLSQKGIIEAEALTKMFGRERYEKYFSSPLVRARHTAMILFPDQEITIDDRLIERGLGKWEGKHVDEMRALHPDAFLPSGRMQPLFTPPDGEPLQNVAERLIQFMRCNLEGNIGSFIVVTHNSVIRAFRSLVETIPLNEIFCASEKKLQPRSYDIDEGLMRIMEERRNAVFRVTEQR